MNNNKITQILCKKYYRFGGNQIYGEFHEGIYYDKFILDETWNKNLPDTIYIYNKNGKGGIRFSLDNTKESYFQYFYDYFYDNKQIRQLKLKKLCNSK